MIRHKLPTAFCTTLVASLLAVGVFTATASSVQADDPNTAAASADAKPGKVYELRIYTCNPGKLDALHARFREHTLKIFGKHGMRNVIYLTPVDKDDTLVYLITHDSVEAAEKNWASFRDDADWKKVYEESHRDGPLVKKVDRQFLKATDYSPIK